MKTIDHNNEGIFQIPTTLPGSYFNSEKAKCCSALREHNSAAELYSLCII